MRMHAANDDACASSVTLQDTCSRPMGCMMNIYIYSILPDATDLYKLHANTAPAICMWEHMEEKAADRSVGSSQAPSKLPIRAPNCPGPAA